MQNKPKYNFFKNWKYALDGLITAIKTESSFKLELIFAVFIILGIVFIAPPLFSSIHPYLSAHILSC